MHSVLAIIRNSRCQSLVSRALAGYAELRAVVDERELVKSAISARPTAVLLERRDERGSLVVDHIRALRGADPKVRVLICTTLTPDAVEDVALLGLSRPMGIVLFEVEPVATVRDRILGTDHEEEAELDFQAAVSVHPLVCSMLRWCLERVGREGVTVATLAKAFNISPEALARKFKRAALPSPRALIAWARLLAVARRIDEGRRGIDAIALEYHFGSASGLRGQLMRYTGMTPTRLKRKHESAFKTAGHLFATAFASCKSISDEPID